jgi:hypothetical protein
MLAGLLTRVLQTNRRRGAAGATAARRAASIDAAVAWWVEALRGRGGTDPDALEPFARALRADLTARLDASYRVYLEANHQPQTVLRAAALAAGLDLDGFPLATTMSVTDVKVEVSRAARAPYELLHSA